MVFNDHAHVVHTAVANFHAVSIENLVQKASVREVIVYQLKELFADIGGYAFAERRVKPYNVAAAFLSVSSLCVRRRPICGLSLECQVVIVSSKVECFLVWVLRGIELFFIARYIGESLVYRFGDGLSDAHRVV